MSHWMCGKGQLLYLKTVIHLLDIFKTPFYLFNKTVNGLPLLYMLTIRDCH